MATAWIARRRHSREPARDSWVDDKMPHPHRSRRQLHHRQAYAYGTQPDPKSSRQGRRGDRGVRAEKGVFQFAEQRQPVPPDFFLSLLLLRCRGEGRHGDGDQDGGGRAGAQQGFGTQPTLLRSIGSEPRPGSLAGSHMPAPPLIRSQRIPKFSRRGRSPATTEATDHDNNGLSSFLCHPAFRHVDHLRKRAIATAFPMLCVADAET